VTWKYFVGACILACGLLFKFGAPLPALAAGVALAGYVNWRLQRRG
jgi:hypothetical protein